MHCNARDQSSPLSFEEFAQLIADLGPFETHPTLAVAVSGGSDSLCLTLLLSQWAKEYQGHLIALTVDHHLRPESTQEAYQVAKWLEKYEIPHHILEWKGEKPLHGIQAKARQARYHLLEEWCRQHNILHLFLAHHADDQAETLLFRLCRGSGLDGLTAMAPVVEKADVRILRPFLNVPQKRLRKTLENLSQQWVDDPTNTNETYTRSRIRQILKDLEAEGLTSQRLFLTANRLRSSRAALESQVAQTLIHCVEIHPEGYALLETNHLPFIPSEILVRVLSAILMCIGGKPYPPRQNYLESLKNILITGKNLKGRTCWGCFIVSWRNKLLFLREMNDIKHEISFTQSIKILWDNRFTFQIHGEFPYSLTLKKLGSLGWGQIRHQRPKVRQNHLPSRVNPTLPAIWKNEEVVAVPHLEYFKDPTIIRDINLKQVIFSPPHPLCNQIFTVV